MYFKRNKKRNERKQKTKQILYHLDVPRSLFKCLPELLSLGWLQFVTIFLVFFSVYSYFLFYKPTIQILSKIVLHFATNIFVCYFYLHFDNLLLICVCHLFYVKVCILFSLPFLPCLCYKQLDNDFVVITTHAQLKFPKITYFYL